MKAILVAVLVVLVPAAAGASSRLGVATLRGDSACVTFRGKPMTPGTRLIFILFSPARVVDGRLGEPRDSSCNTALPQEGQAYAARLRWAVGKEGELAVAVADSTARIQYRNRQFMIVTKGDDKPLEFQTCTSHEGVHLSAWRGKQRIWEEYWYLGYDVEPTCPDSVEGKD